MPSHITRLSRLMNMGHDVVSVKCYRRVSPDIMNTAHCRVLTFLFRQTPFSISFLYLRVISWVKTEFCLFLLDKK